MGGGGASDPRPGSSGGVVVGGSAPRPRRASHDGTPQIAEIHGSCFPESPSTIIDILRMLCKMLSLGPRILELLSGSALRCG